MTPRPLRSIGFVVALIAAIVCGPAVPVTPLAGAARRGDLDEIDRLVKTGADVDEPSGVNDWPPIVHAIHKGKRNALVRLLKHGASLERQAGQTALTMASGYGDVETVKVLLAHGVRIPATDGGAGSLMAAAFAGAWDVDYDWAGCERHAEVVRTLLAHEPGLRRHVPNRIRGLPYSPASLAGRIGRLYAEWYVRHKSCTELIRIMDVDGRPRPRSGP